MEQAPIVGVVNNTAGKVDPTYLNLDYIFYQVYHFFASLFGGGSGSGTGGGSSQSAGTSFIIFMKNLSAVICIFLITVILYCLVRLYEKKIEKEKAAKEAKEAAVNQKVENAFKSQNDKWENIVDHSMTANPNDWRLAIIEADSMLDELTQNLNLSGESLGERLKSASRNSFQTIDLAWEAHKRRNKIAHEGLSYDLTQRETKETIEMYRHIFEEFKII
ncbi:MAG: hypothetical protein WCO58_02520 [bacterium]